MKTIKLTFAAAAIFGLTACGSSASAGSDNAAGADDSQANGSRSQSASVSSSEVQDYFDAYAASDPEDMRAAVKHTAKDSPAQRYIVHQANNVEANDAMGYERYVQETKYKDGSVSICYEGDDCAEYSELAFEAGKLASFSVDGKDISDRVALGDGTVVKYKEDAGFEVLSSYHSASGNLVAVVRFYAYDRPMDFSYTATYRKPSGQQIESVDTDLPSRVAANSNQDAAVIFPTSENGGDLHLKLSNADDEDEVAGDHIFDTVEVPLSKD